MIALNNGIKKIGIVVGETSGDILGANLMRSFKEKGYKVHFFGIAGNEMKKEGMQEVWYNMEDIEIMGIVEIFKKFIKIYNVMKDLKKKFLLLNPDVFIGIDFPDFTINLELFLKKNGIKVIHYVSPAIWAWRKRRIFKIAKATNNVFLLFPFEKKIYNKFNVPYTFVGLEIANSIPIYPDKFFARSSLGLSKSDICMAILPGSRKEEIEKLSEIFLLTALIIYNQCPNIRILIPFVNPIRKMQFECIKEKVAPKLPVYFFYKQSIQVMIASDVALLASGTATLECMLAKCPMVVGYKVNLITFVLIKLFIKISWISIPNILARKEVVKELLQNKCRPKILSNYILSILFNVKKRERMVKDFRSLHKEIQCNTKEELVRKICSFL